MGLVNMKSFAVVVATTASLAAAATVDCTPPSDHSIIWKKDKCTESNPGVYEKYLGYGKFQTRVKDASQYCQDVAVGANAIGFMRLVSVTSSDMDTCVSDLLNAAQATGAVPTASIGARYTDSTTRWIWANGQDYMQTAADYNNCLPQDINSDGICTPQDGKHCLIATNTDSTTGYHWEVFPCTNAHVNFICEYQCNPVNDPGDGECPPNAWWCEPGNYPFMKEMVGFVGNTSTDPSIYVQEIKNTAIHKLPLPAKADGTNAQFPYIAYNDYVQAFEVVGSFNQPKDGLPANGDGSGSYHYYVDFQGNSQSISDISGYDSRSFAAFVFIPDVQSTVLVGGYPPSASDSDNYNRVASRPLIYATSEATGNLLLPTEWPDSYHCQGSTSTCKFLSFPAARYHASQLFVVGGSSYAYCPAPALGGNKNVWSLKFKGTPGSTLQWTVYNELKSSYGACRGAIGFPSGSNSILLTTLNYQAPNTYFQGFEAYFYGGNNSYIVTDATNYGNDMPIQYLDIYQSTWNVMGGAMRCANGQSCNSNLETAKQGILDQGFTTSPTPLFPTAFYGKQLLGATISNQYIHT